LYFYHAALCLNTCTNVLATYGDLTVAGIGRLSAKIAILSSIACNTTRGAAEFKLHPRIRADQVALLSWSIFFNQGRRKLRKSVAHLVVFALCDALSAIHASQFEHLSFDPFSFLHNFFVATEVNIGRSCTLAYTQGFLIHNEILRKQSNRNGSGRMQKRPLEVCTSPPTSNFSVESNTKIDSANYLC
jgi:hypothetical protein